MNSKEKRHLKKRHKKKSITSDSSDCEEGETHELYYYANDRVQLMKEVLKILKSKKIKSLAPPTIQKLPSEEINAMLLDELIGISNKRLKKILDGQNAEDESSSSSDDMQAIDVISLDDISDEDFIIIDDSSNGTSKKRRGKKVKTEKKGSSSKNDTDRPSVDNEKLLSVLEILELQARARAIRSQLILEAENKAKDAEKAKQKENEDTSDDDDAAVIIETPEVNEIVISSSEDEIRKSKETTPQKKNRKIILKRKKYSKTVPENNLVQDTIISNVQNVSTTEEPEINEIIMSIEEIPLPKCTEINSQVSDSDKRISDIPDMNRSNSEILDSNKIDLKSSSEDLDEIIELNKSNSLKEHSNTNDLDLQDSTKRKPKCDKDLDEKSEKININIIQEDIINKITLKTEESSDKNIKVDNDLEKLKCSSDIPPEMIISKDDGITKIPPKKKNKTVEVINIVKIVRGETSTSMTITENKSVDENDEVVLIHLDSEDEDIEGTGTD